jgi:hypothetical protein
LVVPKEFVFAGRKDVGFIEDWKEARKDFKIQLALASEYEHEFVEE